MKIFNFIICFTVFAQANQKNADIDIKNEDRERQILELLATEKFYVENWEKTNENMVKLLIEFHLQLNSFDLKSTINGDFNINGNINGNGNIFINGNNRGEITSIMRGAVKKRKRLRRDITLLLMTAEPELTGQKRRLRTKEILEALEGLIEDSDSERRSGVLVDGPVSILTSTSAISLESTTQSGMELTMQPKTEATTEASSTTTTEEATSEKIAVTAKPTMSTTRYQPIRNIGRIRTQCPVCELSLVGGKVLCSGKVETCSSSQVCQLNIRQRDNVVIAVETGCKETAACYNEKQQNGSFQETVLNQCRPSTRNGPSYCRQCCDGPDCVRKIKQFEFPKIRSSLASWNKAL